MPSSNESPCEVSENVPSLITTTNPVISPRLPHLDALRAFAIAFVLLFHLDVPGFGYGYLGVDLFFILSGYLMTSTMLADRDRSGTFRVGPFFIRRFKRIVPSLALTILATICAAYILMSPEHLVDTIKQGFYAQFFLSNHFFYEQAGYFAPENNVRALLHTWSLSLEEQYYILFGLSLYIGNRIKISYIFSVLTVVAFALLLMTYLSINSKGYFFAFLWRIENLEAAAFYLTPFRLLQFLTGGSIALFAYQRPKLPRQLWLDIAGFSLVTAGIIILFSSQNARTVSTLIVIVITALPLLSN